jgi:hypothetical protein
MSYLAKKKKKSHMTIGKAFVGVYMKSFIAKWCKHQGPNFFFSFLLPE